MPDEVVEVIVRQDAQSWVAWSPQCPGLMVIEEGAASLRAALPPALRFYFDSSGPLPEPMFNLEHEVNGVVIRIRQDNLVYERQLLAQQISNGLGAHAPDAEGMRKAPQNAVGDVVFVCGMPRDTLDWVSRQLRSEDTINVVLPASEAFIWSNTFSSVTDELLTIGLVRAADLGYRPTTTLAEMMRTAAAQSPGRSAVLV